MKTKNDALKIYYMKKEAWCIYLCANLEIAKFIYPVNLHCERGYHINLINFIISTLILILATRSRAFELLTSTMKGTKISNLLNIIVNTLTYVF